jgi:hypothetical protein
MTNLIAYTDFTGDLNLDLHASPGGQAQIAYYITILQEDLFTKLFGINLYAYLDTPVGAPPVVQPKWTELITPGTAYYTYENYKFKYPGLKRMLACYVYCKWQALEMSSSTPEGETRSTSTNGELVFNVGKQVRIWNEMVRLYYEVVNYVNYKNSIDPLYFEGFAHEEIEEINSFGI